MIKSAPPPSEFLGLMDSLADPTRLRLLRLLEQHELGVAELCDVLQMPQSTMSRHLKLLTDQGWMLGRRDGTANLYRSLIDELDSDTKRLWSLVREQTDRWATVDQDQLRLKQRLKERRQDSQAFFADTADRWDRLRAELYGQSYLTEALIAAMPSDWTVADLGCGTGQVVASLAGHVGRVIGVDQSAAMLKAARKRVGKLKNVELRRGDLEAVPIEDKSCDVVLMILVLSYLDHPATALHEAARVLKPDGKVVLVDLLRHDRDDFRRQMGQQWMGFETDELQQLLADAGLNSLTCQPLPPEPAVKGPALILASATRALKPHRVGAAVKQRKRKQGVR